MLYRSEFGSSSSILTEVRGHTTPSSSSNSRFIVNYEDDDLAYGVNAAKGVVLSRAVQMRSKQRYPIVSNIHPSRLNTARKTLTNRAHHSSNVVDMHQSADIIGLNVENYSSSSHESIGNGNHATNNPQQYSIRSNSTKNHSFPKLVVASPEAKGTDKMFSLNTLRSMNQAWNAEQKRLIDNSWYSNSMKRVWFGFIFTVLCISVYIIIVTNHQKSNFGGLGGIDAMDIRPAAHNVFVDLIQAQRYEEDHKLIHFALLERSHGTTHVHTRHCKHGDKRHHHHHHENDDFGLDQHQKNQKNAYWRLNRKRSKKLDASSKSSSISTPLSLLSSSASSLSSEVDDVSEGNKDLKERLEHNNNNDDHNHHDTDKNNDKNDNDSDSDNSNHNPYAPFPVTLEWLSNAVSFAYSAPNSKFSTSPSFKLLHLNEGEQSQSAAAVLSPSSLAASSSSSSPSSSSATTTTTTTASAASTSTTSVINKHGEFYVWQLSDLHIEPFFDAAEDKPNLKGNVCRFEDETSVTVIEQGLGKPAKIVKSKVRMPIYNDEVCANLTPEWGLDVDDLRMKQRKTWIEHKHQYYFGKHQCDPPITALLQTLKVMDALQFVPTTPGDSQSTQHSATAAAPSSSSDPSLKNSIPGHGPSIEYELHAPAAIIITGNMVAQKLSCGRTVADMQKLVASTIKRAFPDTVILYALGSHDYIPKLIPTTDEHLRLWQTLSAFFTFDERQRNHFLEGGFHSFPLHASTKTHIVIGNTLLLTAAAMEMEGMSYLIQQQWNFLRDEFTAARSQGYKVIFAAHSPPGGTGIHIHDSSVDASVSPNTSANTNANTNAMPDANKLSLDPINEAQLVQLLDEFSDVILINLFGDASSRNEMRVHVKDKVCSLVSAGISPRHANSPSIRKLDFSTRSLSGSSAAAAAAAALSDLRLTDWTDYTLALADVSTTLAQKLRVRPLRFDSKKRLIVGADVDAGVDAGYVQQIDSHAEDKIGTADGNQYHINTGKRQQYPDSKFIKMGSWMETFNFQRTFRSIQAYNNEYNMILSSVASATVASSMLSSSSLSSSSSPLVTTSINNSTPAIIPGSISAIEFTENIADCVHITQYAQALLADEHVISQNLQHRQHKQLENTNVGDVTQVNFDVLQHTIMLQQYYANNWNPLRYPKGIHKQQRSHSFDEKMRCNLFSSSAKTTMECWNAFRAQNSNESLRILTKQLNRLSRKLNINIIKKASKLGYQNMEITADTGEHETIFSGIKPAHS